MAEHVGAGGGDDDIIFDADADAFPLRVDAGFVGRDVEAGFDGDDHAGFEDARFVVDAIVADIVHVEPEPVAGLVHVEALVGT